MHDPVSWAYLTAPPGHTPLWGPFSIAFVAVFGLGLVGTVALNRDVGGWLRGRQPAYDTVHRASAVEMAVLAAGLGLFVLRALRVSAYGLDARLWLWVAVVVAVGVAAYYAYLLRVRLRVGVVPATGDAPVAGDVADRSYARLGIVIFVVYIAITAGLYVTRGAQLHPDRVAILFFAAALLLGQWKAFLRDWVPVVLLLFGYEFLRGLAYDYIGAQHRVIHAAALIAADRAMFGGQIPAIWLQQQLFVQGTIHWYDIMSVVVYSMLFVVPLLFAFVLWIGRNERFWQFTLTFLVMTYLGFVIYVLYPAAPPWLASQWRLIPTVQIPFNQVWHLLIPHPLNNLDQYTIWTAVSGDPVAAMPSIHSAYPWITLLFAVKYFRWKGLIFLPYNLAVWFSVLYLGQHWVIDIIAGVALATLTFVAMQLAWPWVERAAAGLDRVRAPAWSGAVAGRVRVAVGRRRAGP
ncbi:MAG TPA: phosphatase PAP2 family protein [Thermomicrobiaceae bacterium]|nr:phosphatase PAP2 family protein [Thermomicrobiaceae bacterium]